MAARRCFGAGVLDQPKPGAPSDEEDGEHTAGDEDERGLHAGTGEHP